MADLIEALHNLARQRGRGDASPLLALRAIPERAGSRISHLPISQRLSQAWISLTGQPFRQHQSLSLSALRRGEPFALVGGGPAARQTLHLLAFELLRGEPHGTALLIAPEADSVARHLSDLKHLEAALATPLRVAAAQGDGLRAAFGARLVAATPSALHERLLRHHDRAWHGFWSHLQLILIADVHRYAGVAAGHLSSLLLRAQRLAPTDPPPFLGATMAEAQDAADVLSQVAGRPWRMIAVDDLPRPASSLALWRPTGDRAREAVALALGMQRAGASVHIVCLPLEVPLLRALLGPDTAQVSVSAGAQIAQVQILAGAACGAAALHEATESGAALSILLLGDEPAERTITRLCARDPAHLPMLDDPPPAWVAAPANAYVVAQHLICAASERPISAAEVDAWQAGSIIARLEAHQQIAPLPEADPAWQPLPGGGDPYEGFDLHAAGASPPIILDDQGRALVALDPAAFDRWAFPGAALPPLRGGYRVIERDEGELSLTIRAASEGRRTFPLRRCTVRVRDCRERRDLRGREVAWGRVVVDEEVYGYREVSPGGAPLDRVLTPALTTSWSAPAAWVDLPMAVGATGQLIGWSMAAAVAVRTLLTLTDAVPAYDAEARRIYMVDAQPGGNGLAAWLYTGIEELLPLAYDIALDCRSDPLLEPLARADMDWLLALLGGAITPKPIRQPAGRGAGVGGQESGVGGQESGGRSRESGAGSRGSGDGSRRPEKPQYVVSPIIPEPVREPPRREPAPPSIPEPPRREPAPPITPEPVREPPPQKTRATPKRETPPSIPEPVREPPPQKTRATPKRETPPRKEPSAARKTPPAEPKPPREAAQPRRKKAADKAPAVPRGKQTPRPLEPPPPSEPRPPEPPPPSEPLPDPTAMAARLRSMREQRERRSPSSPPSPRRPAGPRELVEPRFMPGDTVFCMPWGTGEVRSSQIEDDRELMLVSFADHGDLTIDTAVSAVRLVRAANAEDDDEEGL
ncbi:helicase [Chloroflexales bacterium ZM16-3]|nr:helicase [Chloroflexales bacterium ZM16-3]